MVTTFCHHDWAKVESSAVLSTLCQQDSLKPGVVMVRIFANSPCLPLGSSSFLNLNVTTLSLGMLTTQFSLDQLCLWQLLPSSSTLVVLPHEAEDEELKVYLILQETLWESSEVDQHLSDPTVLLGPPIPFFLHQEKSSQTEEWLSIRLALVQLESVTLERAQLK